MLLYDNKEDAIGKLSNTICLYNGKAVFVREIVVNADGKTFKVGWKDKMTGRMIYVDLHDPLFNYTRFNIGYANARSMACWFYRRPAKQYRQGLKSDQMLSKSSNPMWSQEMGFDYGNPVIGMLENQYPDIKAAHERLITGSAAIVAFHTDFAATYDEMHKDIILEYKGTKIGITSNFKKFELMPDYKHLTESLGEAINV